MEMETIMPEFGDMAKHNKKTKSYGELDDENMSDSTFESTSFTNKGPSKKIELENGSDSLTFMKKAVVVLTRLPEYKISALRPPTPQQFYSEGESLSSSDSDMQWKPDGDSSDSDFSASNRKRKTRKPIKSDNSRTPAPQTSSNNSNEPALAVISSAFSYCSDETTKVRPKLPEEELTVGMIVLAKKKQMRWQRGKILEIVTKEDGRLKYKVNFEEKGKSLVSGHHMAFDTTPKLDQLYVGARVVIVSEENTLLFQPGILVELPSRKNRSRFLVFLDDHVPIYVGLPSLHLVCRPLEDVLDDIPNTPHKSFLIKYLRDWPYPHLTHYTAGQVINVELNGVQQKCEVQVIDSSLMQVVFQNDQHTEWIHRGSVRLEHMARYLELKTGKELTDDSD